MIVGEVARSPEISALKEEASRGIVARVESGALDLFNDVFKHAVEIDECGFCKKKSTNEFKLKHCSKCNGALYCSRECQVSDWGTHRVKCENSKLLVVSGLHKYFEVNTHGVRTLVDLSIGQTFKVPHIKLNKDEYEAYLLPLSQEYLRFVSDKDAVLQYEDCLPLVMKLLESPSTPSWLAQAMKYDVFDLIERSDFDNFVIGKLVAKHGRPRVKDMFNTVMPHLFKIKPGDADKEQIPQILTAKILCSMQGTNVPNESNCAFAIRVRRETAIDDLCAFTLLRDVHAGEYLKIFSPFTLRHAPRIV